MACIHAGFNILSLYGNRVPYNICRNLEWQVRAGQGAAPRTQRVAVLITYGYRSVRRRGCSPGRAAGRSSSASAPLISTRAERVASRSARVVGGSRPTCGRSTAGTTTRRTTYSSWRCVLQRGQSCTVARLCGWAMWLSYAASLHLRSATARRGACVPRHRAVGRPGDRKAG